MSTLKATNIKNESSASNNIVLDSGGGVVVSGILTATTFSGNVSGNITIGAGSTSAPSLAPSGDSNTGVFFPSADTIAFAEGGAEAARFDSSGRLLIGTTSASGSNLLQTNSDVLINGNTVGRGNNSGVTNTALGNVALAANNGNNLNTAVGEQALKTNTSGTRNTAIGKNALRDCLTSDNNTAVGVDALLQVTSGVNAGNTAVGDQAGQAITTGKYNVCMGYQALDAMTIGNDAVAIGYAAFGQFNRTGDTSTPGVAIGSGAGSAVTTAFNNTIIGTNAATSFTTGLFGVYIGHSTTASSGGATDEMVIGTRGGTGKGNQTAFINPNTGGCYQGNNSSSWATTSDRRLKKNIIDNTEGLDIINQVRVVNFEYRLPEEIEQEDLKGQSLINKDENGDITGLQGVKLGVIAQELQSICPDCVREESSGVLSVVDDNLFWHLINSVKELSNKNQDLESEIETLKAQNASILARLDAAGL